MNPVLFTLPLDWSGEAPDNRTRGEFVDLADQFDLPFRVFTLRHGYFYTDTMTITDGTGYVLKEGRDYQTVGFSSDATSKSGKVVCSVIAIINPKVNFIVRVDAQMVGGPYCSVAPAIISSAKGLVNSTRKIHWNNINGKPDKFRPNGHLHALWELFGFTPQVVQLKRMTKAFEVSVQKDFDGLQIDFDKAMGDMEGVLADVDKQLKAHIADKSTNPHREKKTNLIPALSNVQNQPVATDAEARLPNATVMNKYATPHSMALAIKANLGDKVSGHASAKGNLHNLTATQLNVYSIQQWNAMAQQYATKGSTLYRTVRIWGQLPTDYYTQIRQGINVNQINVSAGRLSPARISNQANWPSRDLFLAPNAAWYDIRQKFQTFAKPTTKVVPLTGQVFGSVAAGIAFCNATLGNSTTYPPGSVAVFHYQFSVGISTGNGGHTTITDNVGLCIKNNSNQWVARG